MNSNNKNQMEMFSREWYNEYYRRAVASRVHAEFCESVYGIDLCQHGLMQIEELDFLVSQIRSHTKVLEIGCSNGYITEYIHDRTEATILGLDFSDVAIEQAIRRTKEKSATLRFACVDLAEEECPGDGYDYILLIDSIYFLGDFKGALKRFYNRLGESGKMVVTVFQTKEDGDPDEVLTADGTMLAQNLQELGYTYTGHDFTKEVREHGTRNYQIGEELKGAFEAEGNKFLYEARAAENRYFKEKAENEEIVRYMYIISR